MQTDKFLRMRILLAKYYFEGLRLIHYPIVYRFF